MSKPKSNPPVNTSKQIASLQASLNKLLAKTNVKKAPGTPKNKMKMNTTPDGSIHFSFREYLGEVFSYGDGMDPQVYVLNPGNSKTFPMASQISKIFQQWRASKLKVVYKPLVSQVTASTTGSVVSTGSVIISVQYNSLADPYDTKQEMENSAGSVSTVPWKTASMNINVRKNQTVLDDLYVSNDDQTRDRFNDLGFFQVAAVGVPTNGAAIGIGELYLEHTLVFLKPQMVSGTHGVPTQLIHFDADGDGAASWPSPDNITSTEDGSSPLGSMTGLGVYTFSNTIQDGTYLVQFYWVGGSGEIFVPSIAATNGSLSYEWDDDAETRGYAPTNGGISSNMFLAAYVSVANPTGSTPCVVNLGFDGAASPINAIIDLLVVPTNEFVTGA